MADAYKVIKDVSLPKSQGEGSFPVPATYDAGDYLLADELDERNQERAANGELDEFLEPVSSDEVDEVRAALARGADFHTRPAEHEAEAVVMEQYGHEVVPRSVVLEQQSAGAEDVATAQEEAKADGADERPGLTSPSTPDLAVAAVEGRTATPEVDEERKSSPRRAARKPKSTVDTSGAPRGKAKQEGEQGS